MLAARIAVLGAVMSGCVPGGRATPSAAPVQAAAAGLDVTLDGSDEPVIIEDDARRRDPPPEALRRRIYYVDRRLYRWHPPARPVVRSNFLAWPSPPSSLPADRVTVSGHPAPAPGERFVLFDATGRLGVIEVTGETCPPGLDDCIACADDDPGRRRWARVIEGSTGPHDSALALGPFAADEPLPSPRSLDSSSVRRGRWELFFEEDLDGDGAADRLFAAGDCHPGRRCGHRETWRRHAGRWYAEPREPPPPRPPMHLLVPIHWGPGRLLTFYGREDELGGPGRVVAVPSDIDGLAPIAGDYWILSSRGVVGRARFAADHPHAWCTSHGPACHEAELLERRPSPPGSQLLLAGPIPGPDVSVRAVKLPRTPRYVTRWDPNRAAPELALELTDGTRWTVTSRPCLEDTAERVHLGTCFETRIERPGAPPHRHLTAAIRSDLGTAAVPVCRKLP